MDAVKSDYSLLVELLDERPDPILLRTLNQTFLSSYLFPSKVNESLNTFTSSSSSLNSTIFRETSNMTTRQRDEELAKIEMGVLGLIFIATLLGNAIVILGIFFRRQKMSRMYYFILHLSLADLITAFFNVGAQFIMELTFPSFIGSNFLCKFVKFTQILGPYSSSYVLVMTAIDRYQAICYPLSNCTWTARQSKMMLGIAWAISFVFCIPQLFIFSLQEVMGYQDCWASFPPGAQEVYVTWYAVSFFIVPLVILIFAYTCICRTIWTNFNMKAAAASKQRSYDNTPSPPLNQQCQSTSLHPPNPLQTIDLQSINETDDSVFPKDPLSSTNKEHKSTSTALTPGNGDSRIMSLNSLNITKNTGGFLNKDAGKPCDNDTSKQLEVSWRIDKKGNVSSIRHPTILESNGSSIPILRRMSKDNFTVISPGRDCGDELEEKEIQVRHSNRGGVGGDLSHDVRILKNPNGLSCSAVEYHKLQKYEEESKKHKKEGFQKLQYKWQSSQNKMAAQGIASSNKSFTKKSSSSASFNVNSKNDMNVSEKSSGRKRLLTNDSQPRTSSVKGISRAKIKTVKLTVTVICCYIFCSSPFITAQLWVTFDPNAYQSKFYTGTTFTILTLLASLNSCVNPWIFLFFNPNLLQDFLRGMGCTSKFPMGQFRRRESGGSPVTQKTSPGHIRSHGNSFTSHRYAKTPYSTAKNLTPSLGSSVTADSPSRGLLSSTNSSNGNHKEATLLNNSNSLPSQLLI